MFDRARTHIVTAKTELLNMETTLTQLEQLDILPTYVVYSWLEDNKRIVFNANCNYKQLVKLLRTIAQAFNTKPKFDHGWLSYDDTIKFSWTFGLVPIEIRCGFAQGEVPAELLRGCEVKNVDIPAKTEKRLVCGVKKG